MSIILLVIPTLLIGIISYYLWIWTYWKRRGIPGPMGYPVVGVTREMNDHWNSPHKLMQKWTQEYGKIYGITEGVYKTLVISDPSLINEVFLEQFDNFYGRKINPLQGDPDNDKMIFLFASQGYRWKRLRSISSPSFSNNSLRKVMNTVEECALDLLRHIEKKEGEEIDMLVYYQEYTMDVISKIAMGQTESQMFNTPFIADVDAIFGPTYATSFMIATVIPWFAKLFSVITRNMAKYVKTPGFEILMTMDTNVRKRMEQREEDEKNGIEIGEPADFIDLFLDARADVDMLEEDNDDFNKTCKVMRQQMTVDEIIGQCFVFILAGFDTTALSLSYSSYLLATHPNIMKKLQEEIDRECPDPSISFDQLSKLKYMDCVVKETLRMYPLASVANTRKCMRNAKIGGMEIEEGTYIQVDTWTLHYDKKIWGEDAEEFRPERWDNMDDNSVKSSSYLPFGLGPRQCIGMRLAYMEEKLLLSHILRKYTFKTTPKTDIPLKLIGRTTTSPESVKMILKPRY